MAWLGAVAGGVLSYMGSKEQNKAAGKSGYTDITTTTSPSDESAGYRNWAMAKAFGIMNPGEEPPWNRPIKGPGIYQRPPGASGDSNSDGSGADLITKTFDSRVPAGAPGAAGKKTVIPKPGKPGKPGKAPGGGGGQSGGQGNGKWTGTSGQTSMIVDNAIQQAQKGNSLYGEAEDYISSTLSGSPQQDRNAYRTETADMIRGMDDPDLRRFKDMLFEDVEGARPKGGRGAGDRKVNAGTVGAAYASNPSWNAPASVGGVGGTSYAGPPGSGPVGVVDDIQALLAGQGAPQAVKDAIARRNEEEWNKRIAEKMGVYVGNNQLGSSSWTQALGDVNTVSARELGDTLAMADYGLYQHGLDLGTGYDTAALDRDSRERMSAADRAQSAANASNAAGAAAAELRGRMDLARLDALQNAVGMGQRQNEFRTTGMGSLADLYSQDQRFALGATPDITGLGMRDWTAAGQLSLGSDQNRNQFDIGRRNANAAMAGVNATNQRLAFDRERYQHDVPFMDLSRYMDIINSADRGGSTRQFGQTPPSGQVVNPGMAAVGGAMAGWNLGNSFRQTYGSGTTLNPPPGGGYP